jgi:ABC-type polysaccharide/polyol phosphate transport system ATPase subunit
MVHVDSISKTFKLYRSPADRLKEIVTRKKYHTSFRALNNISFRVADGETLGIIGQNGAGKSTLLKILTGILIPDTGAVSMDGKITGLLELGTGFNPEMTGIQNIYMNGTLLGMTREEIDMRRESVVGFTELGDFIYEPIKTYSSGMLMRLGFSIAIHANPRCFVVDEALAVGDAYFQQKCIRKIVEFKSQGGSIILVSHDMSAVNTLCDSVILLDQGNLVDHGAPKDIIDFYNGMILKKCHQGDLDIELKKVTRADRGRKKEEGEDKTLKVETGEVELLSVKLLNGKDEVIDYLVSEQALKIRFAVRTNKDLEDPHYGFKIRNKFGMSVFETNTYCMRVKTMPLKRGEVAKVTFVVNCILSAGDYSITIGVANRGFSAYLFEEYLLLDHDVEMLKVIENGDAIRYTGVFNMDPKVTVETGA